MTAKTRTKVDQGTTTFIKPKDLKKGDAIQGIYRGSFKDQYEKQNHRLEQADGTTKVINGAGSLDKLISKVDVGTEVEVVYQGQTPLKTGKFKGTKAHVFEVFILGEADAANETEATPF